MNSPIKVRPISVPKISDVLASQLREAILKGEVEEGAMLPSERELVSQSGLSRGAVREALRVLATEGLIRTKLGRFGGNVVTLPGNASMANVVDQFVRGRRITMRSLQETREVLEPGLARLAARNRTEDDLSRLTSIHDEFVGAIDNFKLFSEKNIEWHDAVARTGANELLYAVWYGLSHAVSIATTTREHDSVVRMEAVRSHARINEAIAAGDCDLAETRMRQHIQATRLRIAVPETTDIPLYEEEGQGPAR